MTSYRRKLIKYRKWRRKNPDKADAALLRKIARMELFDKKIKRAILKAFDEAGKQPNPFEFIIKQEVVPIYMGHRLRAPHESPP